MSTNNTITNKDAPPATGEMAKSEPYMIRCYTDVSVSLRTRRTVLSSERLLAVQAMRLLMRLDRDLIEARAQWNQDRFRRVMQARSNAVCRLHRRWEGIDPPPAIPLGRLRRRFHANLAGGFRNEPRQ